MNPARTRQHKEVTISLHRLPFGSVLRLTVSAFCWAIPSAAASAFGITLIVGLVVSFFFGAAQDAGSTPDGHEVLTAMAAFGWVFACAYWATLISLAADAQCRRVKNRLLLQLDRRPARFAMIIGAASAAAATLGGNLLVGGVQGTAGGYAIGLILQIMIAAAVTRRYAYTTLVDAASSPT